ncbi:hypothetical protein HU200_048953 [Digitaria exilis]|uniref:F-box domain-containing protein n=1 Tax=Digitaria exilis TaxID=1010633 RepID=A0A835EAI7_9POAL|nr:hypothetical protein HU200_048953 [Digitaria exilis]
MSDQTTTGHHQQTSPLDDDDLLIEILLPMPPQPSSLPRVSLVCKRWRRLVSNDPSILRRHRAHHRKPPLLGFFEHRLFFPDHSCRLDVDDILFNPIPEPPDRIPPQLFSMERFPASTGWATRLLSCRHGHVLLLDTSGNFFVCDPVTGGHVRLVIPPEFTDLFINAAVLCAAGDEDEGHVHGTCHWSPFKVVLVAMFGNDGRPMVCVYSSETGLWGNTFRHDGPGTFRDSGASSTLIDHALYWEIDAYNGGHMARAVLGFDLDRQTLTVIKGPPMECSDSSQIVKAMDGGVGFATLSYPTLHLRVWHWNVNVCQDDVATWSLVKTVDLQSIFGLQEHIQRLQVSERRDFILGYDEDDGVIFINIHSCLFMLQHDSMQFKKHYERTERGHLSICYPFRSFYPAGDYSYLIGPSIVGETQCN